MNVQWKKLVAKTVLWLAAEILLNSLNLDTIADYSEFVLECKITVSVQLHYAY